MTEPLAATLRHDLRTRLNQIIGYSEMLMEETSYPGQDSLKSLHQSAHATVKKIEKLLPPSLVELDRPRLDSIRSALREPVFRLVSQAQELALHTGGGETESFASHIRAAASELSRFTSGGNLVENNARSAELDRSGATGQAKLLVVDDNASNRQLLCSQLKRLGYDVCTAANGREALDLLRGSAFDLVLLDVRMPELDGFQTLALLQADEALREIPVIMISATDEYDSVIRCIEGGAEDYLVKPFDPILLRARLKASLEKKTLRDQRRQRTLELEAVNRDLHRMQDQLILQEKLASLGSLAAGIAHEIKNPLNFITNFAALSRGLASELRQGLNAGDSGGAQELVNLLDMNLQKIEEHGNRANRVIRGMLTHSRKQSGKKDATDINVLVSECLHLAYHGFRSQDMTFHAAVESQLDNSLGQLEIFAQDMCRVFINLFSNAFYAVNERRKQSGPEYRPTVWLRTCMGATSVGKAIEIHIRDNGFGIPPEDLKKIFEPFYTTKPKDIGTGLGLSISHDIVFGEHGGELKAISEEGVFAEFIVSVPIPAA